MSARIEIVGTDTPSESCGSVGESCEAWKIHGRSNSAFETSAKKYRQSARSDIVTNDVNGASKPSFAGRSVAVVVTLAFYWWATLRSLPLLAGFPRPPPCRAADLRLRADRAAAGALGRPLRHQQPRSQQGRLRRVICALEIMWHWIGSGAAVPLWRRRNANYRPQSVTVPPHEAT